MTPTPPNKRARQEFFQGRQSPDGFVSTTSSREGNGEEEEEEEEMHGMSAFSEDLLLQHRMG
eukprot:CAMPEP_0180254618 /NCGR_PEP_ID=MMETSP0987-20121128/40268_1 /TAXON_ID=697907 /ORGANISM="non described non described, Strain CCMP2293" /LENGTH=61 /DNA_ID=CAMNT_0022223641 /DNA_START=21 /DNA_END=202 /DNA_ORIENTATION=+